MILALKRLQLQGASPPHPHQGALPPGPPRFLRPPKDLPWRCPWGWQWCCSSCYSSKNLIIRQHVSILVVQLQSIHLPSPIQGFDNVRLSQLHIMAEDDLPIFCSNFASPVCLLWNVGSLPVTVAISRPLFVWIELVMFFLKENYDHKFYELSDDTWMW